ncbi:putative kinesin [Babesia divergens]|uniref:Kinesin n=1 Tax=Babesia divergens TaxID=32595 RepID=A0AAD9GD66_BABDI|nr:putative kinesin [Babesia divergens]
MPDSLWEKPNGSSSNTSMECKELYHGASNVSLARQSFSDDLSMDSTTMVESSMILDGIIRRVILGDRMKLPNSCNANETVSCNESVDKRGKLDNAHEMLSGRVIEKSSEASLEISCPAQMITYPHETAQYSETTELIHGDPSLRCPHDSNVSVTTCKQKVVRSTLSECRTKRLFDEITPKTPNRDYRCSVEAPLRSLDEIVSRYYIHGKSQSGKFEPRSSPSNSIAEITPIAISTSSIEKLKVVVRVRPVNKKSFPVIHVRDDLIEIHRPGDLRSTIASKRPKVCRYYFDTIFDCESWQCDLYDATARPLIRKAFEGVHGTIFAYGSTSAGKTYTMLGDGCIDGIVQMSIRGLFSFKRHEKPDAEIRFSFIEIHNECIYDLLAAETVQREIQEENEEVQILNMVSVKLEESSSALDLLKKGIKSRRVAMTADNRRSSRSHAIMQFKINVGGTEAVLSFIDLAGSEKGDEKDNEGERSEERSYINKSLLVLSNCINCLSESCASKSRVKYHESKLTLLLKNSWFSNSAVVIITAIHPGVEFLRDSTSSLVFAEQAKDMRINGAPLYHPRNFADCMTALNESYNAISIIGKFIPEEARESIVESLQSSGLCGTRVFLNLLNLA